MWNLAASVTVPSTTAFDLTMSLVANNPPLLQDTTS